MGAKRAFGHLGKKRRRMVKYREILRLKAMGGERLEHSVLVRMLHGDGAGHRRRGEGMRLGITADGRDERRGDTSGHLSEKAEGGRFQDRNRPCPYRQ